jgi:hypothetical protein
MGDMHVQYGINQLFLNYEWNLGYRGGHSTVQDSNHFILNCDMHILHLSIFSEQLPHALQLFKTGTIACKLMPLWKYNRYNT